MSGGFRVEIHGQPPSWNQSYRIVTVRGHATLKKQAVAERYQADVTTIVRAARPDSFQPKGQMFICYQMWLARDMDADNILKLVNDAIALALGVNDSRFLPVVLKKYKGSKTPRLVISVLDAEVYGWKVTRVGDRWE